MAVDEANPWLTPLAVPQPVPSVPVKRAPRLGPRDPQRGVPEPEHSNTLPTLEQAVAAEMWWVGTHGGAGESSLAALVPAWPAAEHAWPKPAGGARAAVVLAARSNMRGLLAAQLAATQWASGMVPHVDVLGLVIIADAPGRNLPGPLRDMARVVSGGVPRRWSIPWMEPWRLGETPTLAAAPKEVRRLVSDLTNTLQPLSTTSERNHS